MGCTFGKLFQERNRVSFFGVDLPALKDKWMKIYFNHLSRIKFRNSWMQERFTRLLDQYDFLCGQIDKQTQLLKKLKQLPRYRDWVEILQTIPGIGIINVMAIWSKELMSIPWTLL